MLRAKINGKEKVEIHCNTKTPVPSVVSQRDSYISGFLLNRRCQAEGRDINRSAITVVFIHIMPLLHCVPMGEYCDCTYRVMGRDTKREC